MFVRCKEEKKPEKFISVAPEPIPYQSLMGKIGDGPLMGYPFYKAL